MNSSYFPLFFIGLAMVLVIMIPSILSKLDRYFDKKQKRLAEEKQATIDAASPNRDLIGLVIEMLGQREGWSVDRYRMGHETGIYIWIANQEFGVAMSFDPKILPSASDTLKLTDGEKKRVWAAIEAMPVLEDNQVRAFAKRVQAYADRIEAKRNSDV